MELLRIRYRPASARRPYTAPTMESAVQDRFAPASVCFGCGPANASGLRIKSFPADDGGLVATWRASAAQEAFPGFVNGGVIATLLDCHSNWTGAMGLMQI